MITFDATPYTFHALGMRKWCEWESAGGKKHSMAYYSCGIDCSRDGVKSFFGGWPCGESGGVAAFFASQDSQKLALSSKGSALSEKI